MQDSTPSKLKFHYSTFKNCYASKWKELQTYLNKFYESYCKQYNLQIQERLDFDRNVICYIRMDFGMKETKIYATNKKMPSLFADYVTLSYCDHFVLLWILSWFGCENWATFMKYCEKYGARFKELVCLGVSFNVEEGHMQTLTMDGNEQGKSKRVTLAWNKEAYKFEESASASPPSSLEQQQQQQQSQSSPLQQLS